MHPSVQVSVQPRVAVNVQPSVKQSVQSGVQLSGVQLSGVQLIKTWFCCGKSKPQGDLRLISLNIILKVKNNTKKNLVSVKKKVFLTKI